MGRLSATLKTALQSENAMPLWLLTVAFPSGTKRYGWPGYASPTNGLYDARLLGVPPVARRAGEFGHSMEGLEFDVQVEDVDGTISAIVKGAYANALWGQVAVTLQVGEPSVAVGSWLTEFSGYLVGARMPRPRVWALTVRASDAGINSTQVPRILTNAQDFGSCPADNLAKVVPLLYGVHDSDGIGGEGALGLMRVGADTSAYRYLICLGRAKSLQRVFVGGVVQTSGYSLEYIERNGRVFSVVKFTSDPGVDAVVTADATGYEATGDGTGATITGAAACLQHLLANFVFANHQGKANWNSASSYAIDTTKFTAADTFLTARAQTPGRVIKEQTTGLALVQEWCETFELYPFWTADGKVAVAALADPGGFAYLSDPWIRWEQDCAGEDFALTYEDNGIEDALEVSYAYQGVDGAYHQTLTLHDTVAMAGVQGSLGMRWSAHSV